MKKIISFSLCGLLAFCLLAGCGSSGVQTEPTLEILAATETVPAEETTVPVETAAQKTSSLTQLDGTAWTTGTVDGQSFKEFCSQNNLDPEKNCSHWKISGSQVTLSAAGKSADFSLEETDTGFLILDPEGGESITVTFDPAENTLSFQQTLGSNTTAIVMVPGSN